MTVASVDIADDRKVYTGSGTLGPFNTPQFINDDDLKVVKVLIADGTETPLALTTDYTLTGAGELSGGELTLTVAHGVLAATHRIVIYSDPVPNQEADYGANDGFPSQSHERALDRGVMISRRALSLVSRSLRQPEGDADAIGALPSKVSRSGKGLKFDIDGNPIPTDNDPDDSVDAAAGQVTLAAAQAAIAAGHASDASGYANAAAASAGQADAARINAETAETNAETAETNAEAAQAAAEAAQAAAEAAAAGANGNVKITTNDTTASKLDDKLVVVGATKAVLNPGANEQLQITVDPVLNTPQCQLIKSGANLVLLPFGGNRIPINGAIYTIPSAGVSLAPPATNGITYQIYAYDNSGTLALEASTTASAVDTTTGLHIKNGDATRTHVGLARTASSAWVDTLERRLVCSRYNQPRRPILYTKPGNQTGVGAPWVLLTSGVNLDFVTIDGAIDIRGSAGATDANAGAIGYLSLGINSGQVGLQGLATIGSSAYGSMSVSYSVQVALGYHSLQLYGGGVNATFNAGYTGIAGTV